MDDNTRKRRQNDPAQYAASDPRYGQDHGQGRAFVGGSTDRFRAAAPITTPPSAGRAIAGQASGYGYYTETAPSFSTALPANAMQYQAEYGSEQRQQQSFGSYNSGMMYSVNQAASQNAVYDATQQFQSRQPAAMQMLSDVAAPYYGSDPANATSAPIIQHQPASTSSTNFQQSPADRTPVMQGYAANMTGLSNIAQGSGEGMEDEEYGASGLDEAYNSYQNALKEIFQNIRNGMLVEASSSLVEVSDWLLSNVGELGEPPFTTPSRKEALTVCNKGLTADDETLHSDRIKMWSEFNTAWLAVLQKQKDLMAEMIHNGSPPRQPQSLISCDFLKRMAKELIRLCDNIEKHGLVDYQFGVWEERIITILTECVDLIENNDEGSASAGPISGPNPSMGSRRPP